ncbi:hypothetical protein CDL15_Pgr025957 [Punica granatum]|uniref:Serine aminopeptidase S33 domain-containing protein n=1 Tax=Punica granatum TaxID=22663 RepID=A0A218WB54_PUNGR|nr:hypothetical protein CDL15_Pgr025957 [Punica granatum]
MLFRLMKSGSSIASTAIRLVNAGYAVHGMDYEGHGKSDGLQGLVNCFDDVVDDCSNHFTSVCEQEENKEKMRYLLGESMGGAMALCLHRKKPDYWDGAVLVAPMCKIADQLRPSKLVVAFLSRLCNVIPSWRVVPTSQDIIELAFKVPEVREQIADQLRPSKLVVAFLSRLCNVIPSWRVVPTSQDIIELAFKVPEVREQVRSNPYCYKGRPRLKTGYECMRISMELENRLSEVLLPFIVLHGEDDKVTDISVSKLLHKQASSTDKTLKTYPRMWHGLLYGEEPENINIVFSDVIGWLDERTSAGNSRLEGERKLAEEDDALKAKY